MKDNVGESGMQQRCVWWGLHAAGAENEKAQGLLVTMVSKVGRIFV